MRGFVIVMALSGCGFSIPLGDNTVVDARPDDVVAVDAEIDVPGSVCPIFYRAIGTGMYLPLEPTTFQNQHAACLSHGQSTHLAVIDSKQEIEDLVIYGRTIAGVNGNSRFYVGLVQAPMQQAPDDGWVDFADRNSNPDFWAQSGSNEPNDGPDENEGNHQEQVGALQLDRDGLTDLASTENVRAYCECDGIPVGPTATMYVASSDL